MQYVNNFFGRNKKPAQQTATPIVAQPGIVQVGHPGQQQYILPPPVPSYQQPGAVAVATSLATEKTQLIVNGLAQRVTPREFRALFEKFGPVDEARIMRDRKKNRSKGFGFIYFQRQAHAEAAIEALNGRSMYDKTVVVEWASPQRPYRQGHWSYGLSDTDTISTASPTSSAPNSGVITDEDLMMYMHGDTAAMNFATSTQPPAAQLVALQPGAQVFQVVSQPAPGEANLVQPQQFAQPAQVAMNTPLQLVSNKQQAQDVPGPASTIPLTAAPQAAQQQPIILDSNATIVVLQQPPAGATLQLPQQQQQ